LKNFHELGLNEPILKVLPELNIHEPTEIQRQAIPILIQNNTDFIGLAQTGTGKTAAFGLPLVQNIDPSFKAVQALVVTPTRELGQQVAQQLAAFARYQPGVKVEVVYGGKPIFQQIKNLQRKPQIIVATPGRLIDLIQRKAISLKSIRNVVLDEADEMLNMGFKDAINEILTYTPKEKNIWLFSATMPAEIRQIVGDYMSNPQEVAVNSSVKVNVDIDHQFIRVKSSMKKEAFQTLVDSDPEMRAVVFCRTKNDTRDLAHQLSRMNYPVDALHGDLSQGQRDKVMRKFKSGQLQYLIATDVAARGIDVDNLSHVIHFQLPDDMDFYTHRAGRTARAGKKGVSLVLASRSDFHKIDSLQRKLKINFSESALEIGDAYEEAAKPREGRSSRRSDDGFRTRSQFREISENRGGDRNRGDRNRGGSDNRRSDNRNSDNRNVGFGERNNNQSSAPRQQGETKETVSFFDRAEGGYSKPRRDGGSGRSSGGSSYGNSNRGERRESSSSNYGGGGRSNRSGGGSGRRGGNEGGGGGNFRKRKSASNY
jgi:superfamily II DNA/RNA helicase